MAQIAKPHTQRHAQQHLEVDEESRALMANPEFREALDQAKRTPPDELVLAEELERRRRLTPEEIAGAAAQLDQLERDEAAAAASPTTALAR